MRYRVKQAAKILGLHPNTVYRYRRSGKMEAFIIDGKYVIKESEIKRLQKDVRLKKRNARIDNYTAG